MIPVKLTIRDFLSYTDPGTIDFDGFDVACLSGPNGAGKSAILDAITWCVFGKARGCPGGQNQERLIRDGADESNVEFDFTLEGSTYRVGRRRNRSGKSELRFLVTDGEGWRNIAAESLRETEQRIESTLHMDYQAFTASAFFVQGQAEDFLARMAPDERKNVFARLLDLGTYDRLLEAARSKAREAELKREEHARQVEKLSAVVADLDAVSADLAAAEARAGSADGCGSRREANDLERAPEGRSALSRRKESGGRPRGRRREARVVHRRSNARDRGDRRPASPYRGG
jgi:exonuclease SbcC